jgi:hypothetical protein
MKTIIVNVPDKDESVVAELFKKLHLKSRVLTDEELEDKLLAKWIKEGMKSEDVPLEKVYTYFRKHGVDC